MKSDLQNIIRVIRTTLLSTLCSVTLGFVFFQSNVFQLSHPAFAFIPYGFIGGILFSILRLESVQKAIGALILVTFLNEVVTQPPEAHQVLRDVLFIVGLGITIFLYYRNFWTRLSATPFSRLLVLGSLLAINGILVTVILLLFLGMFFENISTDPLHSISVNLLTGFLVGIALGVGFEIDNRLNIRERLST